ncbi:MAG: leucine-rich repeat domain-containing protein [Lachnospiraceae bacterium]|nr:leucine-rich repeat domain-containing protein [Lachnospiraceae bacterium]
MKYYDENLKIYYEIKKDSVNGTDYAVICDSDKKINEINIPSVINDLPVRKIGKKAFLSCKGLRIVSLSKNIEEVDEWAFAFCDNLVWIQVPGNNVIWGKGVFKNDDKLEKIIILNSHEDVDMTAHLLAAASVVMDSEYLIDSELAGSKEWYKKWDTRLEHILNLNDDDGYHLYVLCGEEDLHFDYEEYLEYNREKKAQLCMLRLLNDKYLDKDYKTGLIEYLRTHTVGCDSIATIKVLLKKYADEKKYYKLLLDIDVINNTNLEAVLLLMGDRHAKMKAYIIENCKKNDNDFFDDLEL